MRSGTVRRHRQPGEHLVLEVAELRVTLELGVDGRREPHHHPGPAPARSAAAPDRASAAPRRHPCHQHNFTPEVISSLVQPAFPGCPASDRVTPVIIDGAIYRDGRRTAEPLGPATLDGLDRDGVALAWVGLDRPTEPEVTAVARQFGLPDTAVAHTLQVHQRPRLERYGETLFCVLRTARYINESETIDFGEVHVFLGPNFVVTLSHSETPDHSAVRRDLEARPELLRRGPVAVLHAVMDRIMDDYGPVVAHVEAYIDKIEDEVFNGSAGAPRRVYRLSRAVIAFQRATKPLPPMFDRLIDEPLFDEDERRALRDVHDRALRLVEQADAFRQVLQNILNLNLTLEAKRLAEMSNALTEMSNGQNEVVKKISAWAAILFAPTFIGTIYGMNFQTMPELAWDLGYPFSLALMALVAVALYALFKKQKWI